MSSIKMCCRLRSNIPPPAPGTDSGAAVREPEKSRIAVDSIKTVGEYTATVKLHREVKAIVALSVVAEE